MSFVEGIEVKATRFGMLINDKPETLFEEGDMNSHKRIFTRYENVAEVFKRLD